MKRNSFKMIEEELRKTLFSKQPVHPFKSHFVTFLEMHHICKRDRINDDFIETLNTYCIQRGPGIFITRVTDGYAIVATDINIEFKK